MTSGLVPVERIEQAILLIRGHKVMLDADLAVLYGVETKALNRAVKRNIERFPDDFMFQLTEDEVAILRRQFGTSNSEGTSALRSQFGTSKGRGGRRYLPYAFTEQGVAMLSSVLRSERAVKVNIQVMRTFVKLRRMLATHEDLARKLDALERKYDRQFKAVFDAIRELMTPPDPKLRRRIGLSGERSMTYKKKLIEVALPHDAINKVGRTGKPRFLQVKSRDERVNYEFAELLARAEAPR
jgi:hypothetical protein